MYKEKNNMHGKAKTIQAGVRCEPPTCVGEAGGGGYVNGWQSERRRLWQPGSLNHTDPTASQLIYKTLWHIIYAAWRVNNSDVKSINYSRRLRKLNGKGDILFSSLVPSCLAPPWPCPTAGGGMFGAASTHLPYSCYKGNHSIIYSSHVLLFFFSLAISRRRCL